MKKKFCLIQTLIGIKRSGFRKKKLADRLPIETKYDPVVGPWKKEESNPLKRMKTHSIPVKKNYELISKEQTDSSSKLNATQ